ncbi:hypothetical protein AB0J71_48485, partial [Nonomuraea sp. NPDC049637]|uniref:hypothetical protein n=1 Tax=Nonomuraea sp. NPDC049637 TaxID=3154356 RepID=UPI0034352177
MAASPWAATRARRASVASCRAVSARLSAFSAWAWAWAAVVLGAFAGEVGVGGRGPQGFGLAGVLFCGGAQPVELAPGLLQRGGRPLLLGLGLVPLAQGVVAGLLGRA